MTDAPDPVARLVDELMLVSVLVAGEHEAALAESLERAGASATILSASGAAEGYDLAILLARPDGSATPAVRATVTALSAASERLLFVPWPRGAGDPADGVLPQLPNWFELLAEFGYQPVVEFDAGFLSPGAFLVDRAAIAAEGDLAAFAERLQSPGGATPQDARTSSAPAQPATNGEPDAAQAESRAAVADARAQAAALSARLSDAAAELEAARHALAQAQAQAAGWERMRDWVRACVADPARDTRARLAHDLPQLNALRGDAGPVSLPDPSRRRFWRRRPPETPAILRDAALVRASPLFDAAWYTASIPELAHAPLDPVFHYLLVGAAQGADPGPWFDSAAYRDAHPELPPEACPLVHAITTGVAADVPPGNTQP